MIQEKATVAISGGGPVAMITALLLAQRGVDVTVLEQRRGIPMGEPRAFAYHPPTLSILEEAGLVDEVLALGLANPRRQMRTGQDGVLSQVDVTELFKPFTKYPFQLQMGQDDLLVIVERHLRRHENVRICWNHLVRSVRDEGDHVVALCETPGGPKEVTADWVIGADGSRSAVRETAGIEAEGFTWPERFVVTHIDLDLEAMGYAQSTMCSDPVRWHVALKLNKPRLWRVTYREDPDVEADAVLQRVQERLAEVLGIDGPVDVHHAQDYQVHEKVAATFRRGRVLLAGDAAHVNNPIGGYGLNGGIADARHLARALGDVIADGADDAALDAYATTRRDAALDFAQIGAMTNKRMMDTVDPAKRAQIVARLKKIGSDPNLQREQALRFSMLRKTRGLKVPKRGPIVFGLEEGKTYAWCTCGLSAKQPFCDGSHAGTEYQPLLYKATATEKVMLCGCKRAMTAPFCDGTHLQISVDEEGTEISRQADMPA